MMPWLTLIALVSGFRVIQFCVNYRERTKENIARFRV